jgi:hypothetical protein
VHVCLIDIQSCGSIEDCSEGVFAGLSATPFFLRPSQNGGTLNSAENPLQRGGEDVSNCQVNSVKYIDDNCQYATVSKNIIGIIGSQLVGFEPDSFYWGLLNGRTVTVHLTCSSPEVSQFCVNFEISSAAAAITCGASGGGCSDFCTTSFSPIPVCSCPHGEVLGQDGYTCINLCDPNPCQNGGACSLTLGGTPSCLCYNSYTGPFCSIPPPSSCPGSICDVPTLSVGRVGFGDIVSVTSLSEGYCTSIGGYCSGKAGSDYCPTCVCSDNTVYKYSTGRCQDINEECSFTFSESSGSVPVLYNSSDGLLSHVASNEPAHIIQSTSGCTLSSVEVDTSQGWIAVTSNGIDLYSDGTHSYIKITSGFPVSQIVGQVIRINLSCSGGVSGCLLFRYHGDGNDISSTGKYML